ncbi:MAG TPA: HNH endonuclease [Kiloniellaceae bacterium]|nr:HNH endonuclease [Kiloniellaceae bacterium]
MPANPSRLEIGLSRTNKLLAGVLMRRARILAKVVALVEVDPESGCWIWQGGTSGNGRGGGYPRMKVDGQTVAVHRVVATHFFGYIPGKKQIDHTCRQRLCVNPMHLEIVTHKQNQKRRDAARRKDDA